MRKVRFQHQRKLRQSTSKGNDFSARVSVSEISCPDFRKTLRKSLQMHCNVITNNDLLSNKRKETELERHQTSNLELKYEVKVIFRGLNPHPVFHLAKMDLTTTSAPFEVIHIDFEDDPQLPDLTYRKIVFSNPYSGFKYKTSFQTTYLYLYN